MDVESKKPSSQYGYTDFLRDYLHCDEEELKEEQKSELVSET